jgi:hypothetical protein
MTTSPHAPGHPQQRSSGSPTFDWAEDIAVALVVLTALVIVAGILALLIII